MTLAACVTAPRAGSHHENRQPAGQQADKKKEQEAQAVGESRAHFPGQHPGVVQRFRIQYRKYHEGARTGRQEGDPHGNADISLFPAPSPGYFFTFLGHERSL